MVRIDGAMTVPAVMVSALVEALSENVHSPFDAFSVKVVVAKALEPVNTPLIVLPVVEALNVTIFESVASEFVSAVQFPARVILLAEAVYVALSSI